MVKINKNERICLLITILTFLFHLIFLNFYPVNFEFTFSEGGKYIDSFEKKIIDNYFYNQANTFGFPLLIGLIDKFFFIDNTLITGRLLSASSYLFFGLGFINVFRYYKITISSYFFILFFFLNPLIWTYGFRGIPDLFATSIAFFSFSNILDLKNLKSFKSYFNFATIGISVCIKPFCLIYLGLIFLLKYNKELFSFIQHYFVVFTISLFFPIIYFIMIKINFGFFLIPEKFTNIAFLRGGLFNNLLGYFIILSLFILPLSFKKKFINLRNFFIILLVIVPSSFFLDHVINSPQGELNFGSLNKILGDKNIFFIGAISLLLLISYLFDYFKIRNKDKKLFNIEFLVIVILYIVILSFTRPSQRYLVTILPILMIFFITNTDYRKSKLIFLLVISGHIFFNIFLMANFYLNASINKEIIEHLSKKNILKNTLPGSIYSHSFHFFLSNDEKKYIITTDATNYLKKFHKKFFRLEKKFYLKEL